MLEDMVLGAARRLSDDRCQVTLPQLQADSAVQVAIRAPERIIDVMASLERRGLAALVARHPVRKWRVSTE